MSCQVHNASVRKLKIVKGQIDGIIKMLEGQRNCIDTLNQIAAALSAITSVKNGMLTSCISCCIDKTYDSANNQVKTSTLEELKALLKQC